MFQIPLRVFSEPIPDELPNRTYSLQSRSQGLLEGNTKVVTAVGETYLCNIRVPSIRISWTFGIFGIQWNAYRSWKQPVALESKAISQNCDERIIDLWFTF